MPNVRWLLLRCVKLEFRLWLLLAVLAWPVSPVIISAQAAAAIGPLAGQPFVRMTHDVRGYELVPSFKGSYKNAPFSTNQWGMRDKEYSLVAPPRTYRIALLGSSFTMGGGVSNEHVLDALLEDRLNRQATTSAYRRYEILNFSVGGYGILQNVVVSDKKVFRFAPNAIFLVIHSNEGTVMIRHLISLVQAGTPIEYVEVRQKLRQAGVGPTMEEPELRRRLAPIWADLVRWSYQRVLDSCRQRKVRLVGIVFPEPRAATEQLEANALIAQQVGIPLVRLEGVYAGRTYESVQLPGDIHLNELGHRLVADALYRVLRGSDPLGIWGKR